MSIKKNEEDFDPDYMRGLPTVSSKEAARRQLEKDMARFLEGGGQITSVESKTFDAIKDEVLAKMNKDVNFTVTTAR